MDGIALIENEIDVAPSNKTCAELVDSIAYQDKLIADATKARKAIAAELLSRLDSDDKYIDGTFYTATVVGESVVWSLDNQRIRESMGEAWCAKFSKHSLRNKYIKVTARKDRA